MTTQHNSRIFAHSNQQAKYLLNDVPRGAGYELRSSTKAKFDGLGNQISRLSVRLACGTSLIALVSVATLTVSSFASDFVVDTATTTTNGNGANVLDGNDNLLITSDGSIIVTGEDGVRASIGNNTITNEGRIETNVDGNHGIRSFGADSKVINSGEILTHDANASGIYGFGDRANIVNSGRISVEGEDSNGVRMDGNHSVVNNSGVIEGFGERVRGISYGGGGASVVNSGEITLSGGDQSVGIITGHDAAILNSGSILLGGDSSLGIVLNGVNSIAVNTGNITTTGVASVGIASLFRNSIIVNTGEIRSAGNLSAGIEVSKEDATVVSSGQIFISGDNSNGISATFGASDANIRNLGEIITSGAGANGIRSQGEGVDAFNSGSISTSGDGARGVYNSGAGFNFENAGSVSVGGNGAGSYGVESTGTEATIINSGSIIVDGTGATAGIRVSGPDSSISNSGKVISTEGNSIELYGAGGILNLNAPSFIGGAFNIPGYGSDTAELNIATGASHSVLWKFDPTHLDGGAPKVSGNVPGFYDAGTGRFATYDPTILAIALDQLGGKTGLISDLAARKSSEDDIWISAFGSFSNIDGNGATLDRDIASGGVAFGASRQISNTFRLNGMAGYLNSKADASSRWTQSLDNESQSFFANVNGDFKRENYDLNFGLSAGFTNNDNRRFVNDNLALTNGQTLGQSWATSKYSSWWFSPEITVSRDIEGANGWTFTPLAQARYSFESIQGSNEAGSNANAALAKRNLGLLDAKAEVSASRKFDRIKVTGRAGVQGTASVGAGSTNITLVGITQSVSNGFDNRVSGYVGADLNYQFNDKTSLNVSSKGTIGGGIKSASIFAKLTRKF
ncbi:autotransporter domain-containing protein [Lentilitoribacter sp. EG35]|uniref:autotransporter family protein n=1 Tax=Lentilitoribacter sp. EG35 TaxID=3234192 RepID=UPI00345FB288